MLAPFVWSIPRRLVAEGAFNVGKTDIQILAMKKVVRALDDASLAEGEEG